MTGSFTIHRVFPRVTSIHGKQENIRGLTFPRFFLKLDKLVSKARRVGQIS